MAKSKVELCRQSGNKVGSRWPSLSKKEAITLGWLSLVLMYWLEGFNIGFKTPDLFAVSMFAFQGLDVVGNKIKKKGDK